MAFLLASRSNSSKLSLGPVDKNTKREEIKQLVFDLSRTYPDLKERIFGAMQRLPLPEWEPKGRYKRPKDTE